MTRTTYDELWEKQDDGSMLLVERTERVVSDEEIEAETRPERLQALANRPISSLTPTEKDQLLELLAKSVVSKRD